MFETLHFVPAAIGLAVAAIGIGHAKSKGQSVFVHHATHNDLLPHRRLNRIVGELIGVVTLNADLASYRLGADGNSGHVGHHGRRFASPDDEEAQFVLREGYRPGMARGALWRNHCATLSSPVFHGRQALKRLQMNFFGGPLWRRAAAWSFWGGAAAVSVATGNGAAFVLGWLTPLFVVGQMASWSEQVSEHPWLVAGEPGRKRHTELSHGRFLGAMPPQQGGLRAWSAFAWQTAAALVGRILVVPADLPHHPYHHRGLDLPVVTGMLSWTDSAQAHSPMLWHTPAGSETAYSTIHEAVDAWFVSLANEVPVASPAPANPVRQAAQDPRSAMLP